MRESIGATWIFSICLTFIVLFTAYLAISVNYAKAFRIKSNIVSQIEENEGYTDTLGKDIETYLTAQGYSAHGACPDTLETQDKDGAKQGSAWQLKSCIANNAPAGSCNVCVYRMETSTKADDICAKRAYYRVTTFFKFDLPVINYLTTFQVSGESRYIYDFAGSESCK